MNPYQEFLKTAEAKAFLKEYEALCRKYNIYIESPYEEPLLSTPTEQLPLENHFRQLRDL